MKMYRSNTNRKRPLIISKLEPKFKKSKRSNSEPNSNFEPHGSMISLVSNPDHSDDIDDWNLWVAATATRNYILDDGILDVLKTKASTLTKVKVNYQNKFIKTIGNYNPNNFVTSIMEQGIKFEKRVIKLIMKKIGEENIINIGGDYNPRSRDKYLKTIQALNDGYPVIYQGILRNYTNNTYGIPDLIVRSDYLNKLFNKVPIPKSQVHKKARNLKNGKNYHYVIIDIKFKTLHLKSDGLHLRNDGPIKAYKSQLCIYNEALGIVQGYEPPVAFIMGWKWKYVTKTIEHRGDNCFDRLGRIDYQKSDKIFVRKTEEAIKWVLNVRQNSNTWDLSKVPLPYEELYPNMCNRYDYPYHKLKKQFAEDIEEISLVWKCGPKQRRAAHENGIYSWKDPRCIPETLGIGGEYTSKIVSRILEANRSDKQNIFPHYISNNFGNWKNNVGLEFFVDFEMTCSVFTEFDDLPYADGESLIFMIGVGYVDHEGKWIFRDFTLDRLDRVGELNICADFLNHINYVMLQYDCFEAPALYHWSHAEPSAWKRAYERHLPASAYWPDLNWTDLLKVFQSEPIGIKGCLNYGLKNVAKTFHKHGYINTIWDGGSSCADGADAAVGAYRVDRETREKNIPFSSDPLAQEIIRYNEVDCKVLEEIITYLREYHIDPNDVDLEDDYGMISYEDDIINNSENKDGLILCDSEEGGCGIIYDSSEKSENYPKIIETEVIEESEVEDSTEEVEWLFEDDGSEYMDDSDDGSEYMDDSDDGSEYIDDSDEYIEILEYFSDEDD